jgi:hypothetical protein
VRCLVRVFPAHTASALYPLSTPPAWNELRLQVRHDDAFIAYLNDVEAAGRNAPATAAFNSVALSNPNKGAVMKDN